MNDGTHLHPAIYRTWYEALGSDRIALVTDAMDAAGMSDGTYRLGGLTVEVEGGEARWLALGRSLAARRPWTRCSAMPLDLGPADQR